MTAVLPTAGEVPLPWDGEMPEEYDDLAAREETQRSQCVDWIRAFP